MANATSGDDLHQLNLNLEPNEAWQEQSTLTVALWLSYSGEMTIKRMDHLSVVVDDLAAAIAFFSELGLELEGEAAVEGEWITRT